MSNDNYVLLRSLSQLKISINLLINYHLIVYYINIIKLNLLLLEVIFHIWTSTSINISTCNIR